jgi:hypothetical protein
MTATLTLAEVLHEANTKEAASDMEQYRAFVALTARGEALDERQTRKLAKLLTDRDWSEDIFNSDVQVMAEHQANEAFLQDFDEAQSALDAERTAAAKQLRDHEEAARKLNNRLREIASRIGINVATMRQLKDCELYNPRLFSNDFAQAATISRPALSADTINRGGIELAAAVARGATTKTVVTFNGPQPKTPAPSNQDSPSKGDGPKVRAR